MDLASKINIKNLLEKYDIKPSKKLGQNFLIDENIVKKIIQTAGLQPDDIVLEIGPGIGTITREIAQKVKKVIAVEKDPKMCEILKETLKDFKNIEIINKDILSYKLQVTSYKIIGNLPFYLTSHLIRKFLESDNPPQEMILIIQKEVAQRICGFNSSKSKGQKRLKMNFLAVCVQFFAKPEIISYISKNSFWPSPKVDSAIIKITPQINADNKQKNAELFFKIASAGFSQPRKTLANNLSKRLKLDKKEVENWLFKNNIKPTQRAETLSINEWFNLTKSAKISPKLN